MSLRGRFAALVALSLCLSIGLVALVIIGRERQAAERTLEEQGYALADALAVTFLTNQLRNEEDLIRAVGSHVLTGSAASGALKPLWLVALAPDGRVLFARGNELLVPEHDAILSRNALFTEQDHLTDRVALAGGSVALDLKSRMLLPQTGGVPRRLGAVRLGLGLEPVELQTRATVRTVAALGALAVLLGMAATVLTTRRLVNSLGYLLDRVRRIATGDLQARVVLKGGDELGELEASLNRLAEDLQKRDLLRQYISRTAWDEIERRVSPVGAANVPDAAGDGPEGGLRRVTVLFMDIRNFTALAESAPSREVVELLNEIFTMMVDIIETYGGVLDKFIGDALLTVFYPEEGEDDAIRAVYCAVEMQLRLEQFNQRRAFYGRDAVRAGIGINSGQVIAGTIGARTRKDFTVIGDPVNVAARLEKRSKEGRHTHVVVSEETYAGVSGLVAVEALPGGAVPGRQKPVPVYEIVSVKDVDAIIALFTSSDVEARDHAFRAVPSHRDGKVVPVLVDLLERGDVELVLRALAVLGRLGRNDERIGPVLQAIVEGTSDKRLLATAIRSCAWQKAKVDVEVLRRFLQDPDARVRANTIEVLDLIGGERYLAWIEPLVYDSSGRVRANAAVALWKRGRSEVVSILERLSYERGAVERTAAVFAAGELFRLGARSLPEEERARRASREAADVLQEELQHYRRLAAIIERSLADADASVRDQAVRASAKTRDPGALEGLVQNLRGCAPEQREGIFQAMLKIGLPAPVRRMVEGYLSSREDEPATGGREERPSA